MHRGHRPLDPHPLRRALVLAALAALSGCGFHLRGEQLYPFGSVYIAGPDTSPVVNDVRRILRSSRKIVVAPTQESAEATLQVVTDAREKVILSLTAQGKVREFQLRQRVNYKITPQGRPEKASNGEIVVNRVLLYSDTAVLAKDSEEALLYRDMQNDAVQQLLRRLAGAKIAG